MINDAAEEVLAQIFGRNTGWGSDEVNTIKMCPGFNDIKSLASLLSENPDEEDLQKFLKARPQFLFGLFGQGDDSDIAFVTKPYIGTLYKADFAVLNVGQGGCVINLVEIERSSEPLFTRKSTPAKALQNAIGQVQDWNQWVESNKSTFVSDTVKMVKKLPLYPQISTNGSFRLRSSQSIEQGWRAFGGYEFPKVRFSIIVGRWASMSEEHQKRLVFLNSSDNKSYTIYTYDKVARRAYNRSSIWP